MEDFENSLLYRASRFYVGNNPRRRERWVRYQKAPAVAGGYVLLISFLTTAGFVAVFEVGRVFHVGIRHMLMHAAAFLQKP
jgi:hypothetical protein